jgi:hypothetical protein
MRLNLTKRWLHSFNACAGLCSQCVWSVQGKYM